MQKPHLQQVSRHGIYVIICKILLLLFCIWIPYLSLSNYLVLTLKFNTVPVRLHDATNFLNHETLQSKHVSKFLPRKYDVISQLRHSYAKGPFCVARLICVAQKWPPFVYWSNPCLLFWHNPMVADLCHFVFSLFRREITKIFIFLPSYFLCEIRK